MNKELPEHRIKSGKYQGQVIDNRTRRSLIIVEEDDQSYLTDYFFHNGKFYSARFPKNAVKRIIGQQFSFGRFNPFITHAQVRFTLDEGIFIELYELGEKTNPIRKLTEFVYSLEVVGPKGTEWSIMNGFGAFVSAHRFVSVDEVVFERVVLGRYTVNQSPPILLAKEQLNEALDMIIRKSDHEKLNKKYYILTFWLGATNCTSEMFKMLDKLMTNNYSKRQKIGSKLFWRFPFALSRYLKVRGALERNCPTQTLNEEFSELAKQDFMLERLAIIRNRPKS